MRTYVLQTLTVHIRDILLLEMDNDSCCIGCLITSVLVWQILHLNPHCFSSSSLSQLTASNAHFHQMSSGVVAAGCWPVVQCCGCEHRIWTSSQHEHCFLSLPFKNNIRVQLFNTWFLTRFVALLPCWDATCITSDIQIISE